MVNKGPMFDLLTTSFLEVVNRHATLKKKLLGEIMPLLLIKTSVRLFILEVD